MKQGMLFGVYDIFFLRIENENCRLRAGRCARHIFTEFGTPLPPPFLATQLWLVTMQRHPCSRSTS